jgi:hypothetical protein
MTVMEVMIMDLPCEPPIDDPLIVDPPDDDDDLIDRLIETNPEFRAMLAKAKASPSKPFDPAIGD